MDYAQLVENLTSAGNETRCDTLKEWLEVVGFTVKKGRKGNHHVLTHSGIPSFTSTGFDCGHGKNSCVKRPYIRAILNHVVKMHEDELRAYLKENV